MPRLRILFTAGSASSTELVQKWKDKVAYYNGYGPTENSVATSIWPVSTDPDAGSLISIGRPVPNHHVYIVDPYGHLLPVGVPGELCVAGVGLARGYLDRPELTSEKFVISCFSGERMYRTGDLARWLPNGRIEYLGRIDHQVKIRGYRIELGEVEAKILQVEAVQEAIVIAREDASGQNQLCAYFVGSRELAASELRSALSAELPGYMVPSTFMQLEQMPLTPNGKIDRKALPAPDGSSQTGAAYTAPRNELEAKLVRIWQDVLGISKVGIQDNFFELGGHSLRAAALVSLLQKELGRSVPLKDVFQYPTIEQFAEAVEGMKQVVYASIPVAKESEHYPVASTQKRLYILSQLEGGELGYNMPGIMTIEGILDLGRFEEAFRQMIVRHETLRTSFDLVEGEPVQRIHLEVPFALNYRQAGGEPPEELIRSFIRPFDLSMAPLLRVQVVELEQDRHLLLFDMHHIISDGVSMGIFINELVRFYKGEELLPLRIQYKDFAVWRQTDDHKDWVSKQEAFWLNVFHGEIPVLELPADYVRPAVRSYRGDTVAFTLDQERSASLRQLATQTGSTMYMVLLAAYTTLLYAYSGREDVVVGSPIAGRPHTDLEPIIGMFVNTLALRSYPAGNKSFDNYLQEVKEHVLQAFEHQDYPFEELIERLDIKRDLSRNPLFDTMFVMQHTPRQEQDYAGLQIEPYPSGHTAAQFDLTLEALDMENVVACSFQFADSLYKRETIERMVEHFLQIIDLVLKNQHTKLADLEIITAQQKAQILHDFNDTEKDYPCEKTIYGLFEEQAERTPDRVAVRFEDEQLTYRELNEQANRMARTLRAEGVLSDDKVGIMVERSLEMIVGIYAILKAGGAYVPIDPEYPEERISFILEDSGAKLLLTQRHLNDRLPTELSIKVIDLNDAALYAEDSSNLQPLAGPRNVAYVIYTSGSTGKPKGVMIEHHSVINRILWMHERYPIGETDVILQKTAFTFDVSVWELFWWAMVGSSVCMLAVGGEKSPERILATIERSGVTTMHFVPAMLHAFLDYAEQQPSSKLAEQLGSLRQVFASGEALPPQHVARFQQAVAAINRARLINLYGPTEATVDVSYFDCEPDAVYPIIPIGKPIHNTRLYIVKEGTQQLQPIGVAGELCIAGVGVARGYLNRPELTAEKFTDDPFADGQRMYRTGDLARWLPDGNIEYLGRIDHQVKIRGYRIELGEVESQLLNVEAMLEAVVVAREDENGQKLLCAYYVAEIDLTVGELRSRLSETLPSYMVPTYLVQVERMPLSPNGKIDRKALPAPEGSVQASEEYAAPRTRTEIQLARLWQEVLRLPRVGVTDNFFDIGGHSLRATTLAAKIYKEMNINVPLRDIFLSPTIEQLAKVIAGLQPSPYAAITKAARMAVYPVSSAQKRLYILSHLAGGELSYNMPTILTVKGPLNKERLEQALQQLIERHETLRTGFETVDGEVVQRIYPNTELVMEFVQATEEESQRHIHSFVRPFALQYAPLLRVRLIELELDRHMLLYDMHHIISDGVSAEIIVHELAQLYAGQSLPELQLQYKDYAVWQRQAMQSERYRQQELIWLNDFAGELPVLDFPIAYPRPAQRSFEGALLEFAVEDEVTERLRKLTSDTGSTLYMLLMAAYTVLLSKYSGSEDVIVGTPVAGRLSADLEPIVGMFVNTLALRNYPAKDKAFLDYILEVKERTLVAFDHQEYPLEELLERLNIQRDPGRNPLFDTMFVMNNTEKQQSVVDSLSFESYVQEHNVAKFDLTLTMSMDEGKLRGSFEYCTKLFNKYAMDRLIKDFLTLLAEIGRDPARKISEINLSESVERSDLLQESIDFTF
ncbi:amino acid adenylation domain-containing protein [Paenibacillus sp. SI92]|uniref:amino acid adenylation domain-containing protein n=1 Tax=Paenibacillus sp. SI92 TaxID=3163027 RepID=UPI003467E453